MSTYDRRKTASNEAGYPEAKRLYQKLTEVMSSLNYEELTDTQRDSLKRMNSTLKSWVEKL